MGDGQKNGPRSQEREMYEKGRRSLHAYVDIKKGSIITNEMLCVKRPGLGLAPHRKKEIIGKKAKKVITDKKICESKYRESRNSEGKLTFLNKKKSLEIIKNKIVIDLKNNKKRKLFELGLKN